MGYIIARIAAPRAGQSRVMLNHFFSQRQGWDLAEELTEEGIKTGKPKLLARPLPNGGTGLGFDLADTTTNRERFEAQFNRPFEEGQSLTKAQEIPIVINSLIGRS